MADNQVLQILKSQLSEVLSLNGRTDNYELLKEWHAKTRPYIGRFLPAELPTFDEYLEIRLFFVVNDNPETRQKNNQMVENAINRFARFMESLIDLESMQPVLQSTTAPIDANNTVSTSPRIAESFA